MAKKYFNVKEQFGRGAIIVVSLAFIISCHQNKPNLPLDSNEKPLFSLVDSQRTGIDFNNEMEENAIINGLMFEFMYNGGGVAAADFNNDDLVDLYFISNLKQNQFYLNRGDLKFENATKISGLEGRFGFPTGVTVVDINYDGWLDIYVCKMGSFGDKEVLKNELYINKGVNDAGIPVFEEKAAEYNLDIDHYSIQSAFFDYDKDGDLDMFLINYGIKNYPYNQVQELIKLESANIGERLYSNDNQKFYEVTKEAGIINNQIGYGLGLAVGDINNDQWPDVIVANDFSEKDHIYINQKDGTFTEVCRQATKHISSSSMGNGIGDVNNDGWLDYITLDMMSDNNYDIKTSMGNMEPSLFNNLLESGLHYQYMYNTLQLNNGVPAGSDIPVFSEIAQLAGVSSTDWSWAPLLFDMDNDGNQDLFISNGIKRDFRNNDFVLTYRGIQKHMAVAAKNEDRKQITWLIMEALSVMPTRQRTNYFYLNRGDLTFEQKNIDWGIRNASVTNGAIYADLDNDGDLDIVGNNMDAQAFVYENQSEKIGRGNYLQIRLSGPDKNPLGIGTRVSVRTKGKLQIREQYFSRGYQSAVSDIMHFGLGDHQIVDTLEILWPDGKMQIMENVSANIRISIDYDHVYDQPKRSPVRKATLFNREEIHTNIFPVHQENEYDDFIREPMLPHKLSQSGPALAVGDVNGDGLDDFYIGGAHLQPGKLFVQEKSGSFKSISVEVFIRDKNHEDVDALFFDADYDGNLDLYVVSGGNEFEAGDSYYQDRLYRNLGNGRFEKLPDALPSLTFSGSKIVESDFDHDGDLDLFAGGRLMPGKYPLPGRSVLLRNESTPSAIRFVDITDEMCPQISDAGMVTSAIWADLNEDSYDDLVIAGEWMPISIFTNYQGKTFAEDPQPTGLNNLTGWWNCLESADFDSDGDIDLVAGNLGLNHKYKASISEPFEVCATDFDNNGTLDVVLSYYENGMNYPVRDKDFLMMQMPFIASKFMSYHDFAMAGMADIFGGENLKSALNLRVVSFASSYIENLGNGAFAVHPLPNMAQFSSVNSILVGDINNDNKLDLLISGNDYESELETPRNDASIGLLLTGDGKGQFHPVPAYQSGLYLDSEVVHSAFIHVGEMQERCVLFGINNDVPVLVRISENDQK